MKIGFFSLFSYTVLYNVRWHLFLVFAISFACVWGEQTMFVFLASDVHKLAYTLLTQNKKWFTEFFAIFWGNMSLWFTHEWKLGMRMANKIVFGCSLQLTIQVHLQTTVIASAAYAILLTNKNHFLIRGFLPKPHVKNKKSNVWHLSINLMLQQWWPFFGGFFLATTISTAGRKGV